MQRKQKCAGASGKFAAYDASQNDERDDRREQMNADIGGMKNRRAGTGGSVWRRGAAEVSQTTPCGVGDRDVQLAFEVRPVVTDAGERGRAKMRVGPDGVLIVPIGE